MNEGMDTLPNEVKTFGLPVVVKMFEFQNPLEKRLMGQSELLGRYLALIHDSDSNYEFAVVLVVLLWK